MTERATGFEPATSTLGRWLPKTGFWDVFITLIHTAELSGVSYLKTRDLEHGARAVGHRELATTRRYLRLGSALDDHPAMLMDLTPHRG